MKKLGPVLLLALACIIVLLLLVLKHKQSPVDKNVNEIYKLHQMNIDNKDKKITLCGEL